MSEDTFERFSLETENYRITGFVRGVSPEQLKLKEGADAFMAYFERNNKFIEEPHDLLEIFDYLVVARTKDSEKTTHMYPHLQFNGSIYIDGLEIFPKRC